MGKPTLEEWAAYYSAAAKRGRRPAFEAAEHFNVPARTASYKTAAARRAGLLPSEDKRPGVNPKLVAVAQALGVSVESLHRAIEEHADGDLRIVRTKL